MEDNTIAVPCEIDGCDTRVVGDVRCEAHGGHPDEEHHPSR